MDGCGRPKLLKGVQSIPPTPAQGGPTGCCRKSRKIAQIHLQLYVDPYRQGYMLPQHRSARRESEAAGRERVTFAFLINLIGNAAGRGTGLRFPQHWGCEFGKYSAANPLIPAPASRNGQSPAFFAMCRVPSPAPLSKQWTINKYRPDLSFFFLFFYPESRRCIRMQGIGSGRSVPLPDLSLHPVPGRSPARRLRRRARGLTMQILIWRLLSQSHLSPAPGRLGRRQPSDAPYCWLNLYRLN